MVGWLFKKRSGLALLEYEMSPIYLYGVCLSVSRYWCVTLFIDTFPIISFLKHIQQSL